MRTPTTFTVPAALLAGLMTGCAQGPTLRSDQDGPRAGSDAGSDARDPAPAAQSGWPAFNTGPINALDLQGTPLTAPAGTETWLSPAPDRPTSDYVLVLDFWATWCQPCLAASPKLDRIQRQHEGEVLVLAFSGLSAGSKWPEDDATIRRFIADHPVAYRHLHDPGRAVYSRVRPSGIPHTVVISTDGIVRWQGNPHDPRLPGVVDAVVRADPGLAARRTEERNGG